MDKENIKIVLDSGSRSIKAGVFDSQGRLIGKIYHPIKDQLKSCLKSVLVSLSTSFNGENCVLSAITGINSNFFANLFGLKAVNGILSIYLGVKELVPNVGAILEIAGEHTKFIRLENARDGENVLKDFFINSACSAGTGTFLEQEAHRLNLSMDAFGRIAAQSTQAIRVAGRCAVFAKTDIVHLHQNGIPLADIAHSLCHSMAQNVCNELILSREFLRPLVFVGGVAANQGMRKALQTILELDERSFIVPSDHFYPGVIGSYLFSRKQKGVKECALSEAIRRIDKEGDKKPKTIHILKPLQQPPELPSSCLRKRPRTNALTNDLTIGIDIGSTTTNVLCITSYGDVLEGKTFPTQGQALTAVFQGLSFLKNRFGVFQPKAVGITGSGRKFVSEIIGADATLNEITAHFLGGLHFFPQVDTIFDIGGQDSKFIQVENGAVVNFVMNKVCSAGTGSFLEEMSEFLGLKIKNEFAKDAMRSRNPIDLGERCTVFMSTELMRKMQEGEKGEDLAAGLCYSVVNNYLSRVVGKNRIGDFISFQGGVASNPAVVSALENLLNKTIHVHHHHEIAGALGAALFALRQKSHKSRFRGFEDLDLRSIHTKTFECQKCSNTCRIHLTKASSGNRFYSGGLCDRYEGRRASPGRKNKDKIYLFEEREKLLNLYINFSNSMNNRDCIGIPRALHFYDLIPFWSTFFNELQQNYRISEPTSKATVHKGVTSCPTNPCLPVKTAYGHCLQLCDDSVKRIFIPCISNMSFLSKQERLSHVCPASQAWSFTASALLSERAEFLIPTIRFSIPHLLKSDIMGFGKSLGYSKRNITRAFQKALEAQNEFYDSCQKTGKIIFSELQKDNIYTVILSRPYTVCDQLIQYQLKKIFEELNIVAIPLDMVPCEPKSNHELDGMYWYYGKRFLQAVDALAHRPEVAVIHLSNFGCGSDSFTIHFLRQKLRNRPFLELEIDDHHQFTGISTRLEAFASSLKKSVSKSIEKSYPSQESSSPSIKHGRLLIPQMSIHAYALQASFRAFGVDAEVLPLPDEESISCGKQSVAGGECLPCTFLIGDMLKYMKCHQNEHPNPTFFMISGDGPCRLGQYPYLQRLILDERGFKGVSIFDASQDQAFYDRFGHLPAPFKRRAWRGVIAVDLLFRKWRESRPYAENKKYFDQIYTEEIGKICRYIQEDMSLPKHLKKSIARLDGCIPKSSEPKPIIAVLGENYVRCNSVANGKIADMLEELGAEVWFPSLYEWVYYGNWTARLHSLYERKIKKYFHLLLIDTVQHWDERRITRAVKRRLHNLKEPSVAEDFKLSQKYVPKTFEGETVIEVARTIDFFQKGACGVIRVVPFGCMMGTIVETLSERISRDLSDFPILTLYYDGQDYTSHISKLEAFMIRAQVWREKRKHHENISVS